MHRTHLGQLGEKGSFGSLKLIDARALDLLEVKPDDVLLEIGTGLGYQAAVLAELAGRVYSVEIIDELAQRAIQRPKRRKLFVRQSIRWTLVQLQ
jgi:protein-L-isoaspartate O-methyltransferase